MTVVQSEVAIDAVQRRKLHVHVADLRKDAQRLRKLVELTRPARMPSLLQRSELVIHSGCQIASLRITRKTCELYLKQTFTLKS